MSEDRLDLSAALTTLLGKEELLAFFRFQLGGVEEGVMGICTVTVPAKGASNWRYVTLCFLSETADLSSTPATRRRMREMQIEKLKSRLPEVQDVALSPALHLETPQILRQVDVYLGPQISPTRAFLEHRLVPALAEVTGMKVSEFCFWKKPEQKAAATLRPSSAASSENTPPEPTLFGRLRNWLGK